MPDTKLSDWTFENVNKIPSSSMYIVGTHPYIKRDKYWLLQFILLSIGNALCLFFLCNSIFLHDSKNGKFADASKNFAMLIICFNSNIKYYTMLYCRDSVIGLIKTINQDYEAAKEFKEEEKNIILAYSQKGNKICKFWVVVATTTCAVFPVKACILMTYYYFKGDVQLIPMFDFTFPNIIESVKDETWAFCGVFALCFYFDCYALLVYVGFEPLIPIFTLHICGQLQLLGSRISKVITESSSEREIERKLKDINVKLQEMYIFMDHVQKNFMILMEFNMKSTAFILPCNAFQIVEEYRKNDVVNVEFIVLFLAGTIHFLTPCYFSDILMEESENFRNAIYSCGWENCRYRSVRKMVLLMITRAGKPFNISTIFYFVSLDTFSTMCRQAYAIFNVMTAAWS